MAEKQCDFVSYSLRASILIPTQLKGSNVKSCVIVIVKGPNHSIKSASVWKENVKNQ